MAAEKSSVNNSSTKRLLVLVLLLPAFAIAHALGVPIPGLSEAPDGNHKRDRTAVVSIPNFVSESWYSGAEEYVKAEADHRQAGVPLVVYFYTDWCPYCKKFDREILTSIEVIKFMNSVVKVRVNPETGPEEATLANRYGVRGYPSIFVVDPQTGTPTKVYPFKQVGGSFVPVEPLEFVRACGQAAGNKAP